MDAGVRLCGAEISNDAYVVQICGVDVTLKVYKDSVQLAWKNSTL